MASPTNRDGKRKRSMTPEEWKRVADHLATATKELNDCWDEVMEHYPLKVHEQVRLILQRLNTTRMKLSSLAYGEHGEEVEMYFHGPRFIYC